MRWQCCRDVMYNSDLGNGNEITSVYVTNHKICDFESS